MVAERGAIGSSQVHPGGGFTGDVSKAETAVHPSSINIEQWWVLICT